MLSGPFIWFFYWGANVFGGKLDIVAHDDREDESHGEALYYFEVLLSLEYLNSTGCHY
jgi:hypothetical protein